jgi:nucleoside-diphosphate-sugar epimerase
MTFPGPVAHRRVLVTGASGFIGRWSVAPLLQAGFDVHSVLSGASNRDIPRELAGSTAHFADLLQESGVDALLAAVRPTHLLHFAWIAKPGVYWNSEDNFRWLSAGRHLLRSFRAQGGVRAVMAGSCAEYDWSRASVCDERLTPLADESDVAPSPYAACKIALQRTLADFGREVKLSTAWGRIFLQFGPYEYPERLVPSVIRNLLTNREAPCSHGRQIRSFLHAADVAGAFARVLDSDLDGPVNIGSEHRTAIAELIGEIGRQIGRPDLVRLGARSAPALEPPILVPEIHRLRDEAKWRPRFTLNGGLADTIDWWRRQSPDGSRIEGGTSRAGDTHPTPKGGV